jgi:hypothetical protein
MESINREVLDKREVIKSIFKKTDEKKQQLLPDPILNLKYILGFSGKTCNLIKFSKNEGKKYVFFPSGNIMINFDYTELKQKFFFGHSKPITQYIFSSE